jgi:hypothetical protein
MTSITTQRRSFRKQLRSLGFSTVPIVLTVAMPKCPLCWAALMSALAVGPAISFQWLRPLAVALLLISIAASFLRSRQRDTFGPFYLTMVAAVSIYLFKFTLNVDAGVYVAGVGLFVASIWNALPKHARKTDCACQEPSPRSLIGLQKAK